MQDKEKYLHKIKNRLKKKPVFIATIEVPRGFKKPNWDKPCFLDYGFIEGYINPFDSDPLDVYFFNFKDTFSEGEKVKVKAFGILKNKEGDLKVLVTNEKRPAIKKEDVNKIIERENVYNPETQYVAL